MKDVSALVCERFRAFVSLELDGELAELEHAMLDSHLERCARCRAYRADVVAVTAALLAAKLERAHVTLPPRTQLRQRRLHAAAAAAFVVLTALGSVMGMTSQRQAALRRDAAPQGVVLMPQDELAARNWPENAV